MAKPNTSRTKLDLLTHPVRLRILLALAGSAQTSRQIAAALDDVPASSIYRHLQKLIDAGVVEVVAERRVRGAVEKTLRVAADAARLSPDEFAQMSGEDHRRTFLVFVTELLHEFERYISRPDRDFIRDLAGYRTVLLYATDEEWLTAIRGINQALLPLLSYGLEAGRRLRRFATITLPLPDEPQEESS